MYPIQLNLKGKHVVIIAGGKIAWRKFSKLKSEPCSIDVIAREFHELFDTIQLTKHICLIQVDYQREHIAHADLIIIATNQPER
ncbi:hypothetical protein KJC03_12195 [Mammaliicoccus sciuri]|uniref:precorrin-2 dehydrogenase/sirohydrochlorin ferrochelatase family protein n=1 Tax=Mammaliicoccus sciuri TaxID=1296 RepID=UPI000E68B146|nr:NAD(P)-dependent oxidoreductase [Mammaliicoccus sciuri]MCE5041854.1 hypothetical protein [Mammaliicoccus sciuri]RIN89227.1 hypothetical protein BU003_10665 [Mammaliicoccus sciuri]RIO72706.1 hypothetical protein BUZ85_10240 [Mammaliicoccus sciuri]